MFSLIEKLSVFKTRYLLSVLLLLKLWSICKGKCSQFVALYFSFQKYFLAVHCILFCPLTYFSYACKSNSVWQEVQSSGWAWHRPLQYYSMESKGEVYPSVKRKNCIMLFYTNNQCVTIFFLISHSSSFSLCICVALIPWFAVLCLAGFGNLPGDMVCNPRL